MALQAGVLNIGGYMACHRFVSHVTGFATFFGVEINYHGHNQAVGMLFVPLFFLFGSMLSGLLVDTPIKLKKKPKYYISFGVIFFLVLTVFIGGITGYFGKFGEPLQLSRDYTLLSLLCLACGVQNGAITSASKAVVRTTHLTGITTDLGLGIVRYFYREKLGEEGAAEAKANLMRAGIILFFVLGSVLGGFAFSRFEYYGFAIPVATTGVLFAIMLYFQIFAAVPKS